ncbi:M23 family metallopeptidase [Cutibacterium sp.]|uniref:M23 family metallopeptidase n=1 Tax=Cutibacterium sp. TaxID=1912221 RepID=UPI0026DAB643|nr:peptidoglycan DD-metalloendopeptidase family protein [Cutibacterium sp.]MDO4412347.1 peptidoglycan DD-metalloendopeptidase family protein [Cutibacterium sp.]
MVSRHVTIERKAIKTAIAGGVGVAVVGLSVAAAWPSDSGLRAVPEEQLVAQAMPTASSSSSSSSAPRPSAAKAPLLSKPLNGAVTSPFGMRYHPILKVWKLHSGVDFGIPCGTPVGASAPGKVTFAGPVGGYGNRVEVDHGVIAGKHVATTYNHLSAIKVRVGQKVAVHQIVATSGTTGMSTGCHLHYEVIVNGQVTDPLPWFNGNPVVSDLGKLKPVKGATVPADELNQPDPVLPTGNPSRLATSMGTPGAKAPVKPSVPKLPDEPGVPKPPEKSSVPKPPRVPTTEPVPEPSTIPAPPEPTPPPKPAPKPAPEQPTAPHQPAPGAE